MGNVTIGTVGGTHDEKIDGSSHVDACYRQICPVHALIHTRQRFSASAYLYLATGYR